MSELFLVIEDVRKNFGKAEVLRGIDLSVSEHEVICLIGASGSGKSTLLRCINLVEPVTSVCRSGQPSRKYSGRRLIIRSSR